MIQLGALPIHPELANRSEQASLLLRNIKEQLPKLEKLLAAADDHWGMEDGVYRFYHQSFKVYGLQSIIVETTAALQKLLPGQQMNDWFAQIIVAGTREKFSPDHNRNWTKHARPIVEAFFHTHFMLKMVCKCGRELSEPPQMLQSGWAQCCICSISDRMPPERCLVTRASLQPCRPARRSGEASSRGSGPAHFWRHDASRVQPA